MSNLLLEALHTDRLFWPPGHPCAYYHREQLGKMYMAIHRAGVMHGDVHWDHIRVRGVSDEPSDNDLDPSFSPQDLVLISWNLCIFRESVYDPDCPSWTEGELFNVATLPRCNLALVKRSEFEEVTLRRLRGEAPREADIVSAKVSEAAKQTASEELDEHREQVDVDGAQQFDSVHVHTPRGPGQPPSLSHDSQDMGSSDKESASSQGTWSLHKEQATLDSSSCCASIWQQLSRVISKVGPRGKLTPV